MKHCAICGQAAQRGSICQHCRAALKRARDQTVSQFQALPAFAVGGASPAREADLRIGRSVPDRRGARHAPPRAKSDVEHVRKPRMPLPGVQGSVLLEVPQGTRGAPFIWVIVTLMVFVVTYVAYRVFTTAGEPIAAHAPAPGVDTPEDLARVQALFASGGAF